MQTANHDLQAANQAANHELQAICKPWGARCAKTLNLDRFGTPFGSPLGTLWEHLSLPSAYNMWTHVRYAFRTSSRPFLVPISKRKSSKTKQLSSNYTRSPFSKSHQIRTPKCASVGTLLGSFLGPSTSQREHWELYRFSIDFRV